MQDSAFGQTGAILNMLCFDHKKAVPHRVSCPALIPHPLHAKSLLFGTGLKMGGSHKTPQTTCQECRKDIGFLWQA